MIHVAAAALQTQVDARSEPSTQRAVDLLESLFFRPSGAVKDFSRCAAARSAVLDSS
jgi:hypothetical protein